MHKTLLPLSVGLGGVAVGIGGTTYVGAQGTPQITRTEILRQPMSGIDGKVVGTPEALCCPPSPMPPSPTASGEPRCLLSSDAVPE